MHVLGGSVEMKLNSAVKEVIRAIQEIYHEDPTALTRKEVMHARPKREDK